MQHYKIIYGIGLFIFVSMSGFQYHRPRGRAMGEKKRVCCVARCTYGLEGPKRSFGVCSLQQELVFTCGEYQSYSTIYIQCIVLYVYPSWMIDHTNKINNLYKRFYQVLYFMIISTRIRYKNLSHVSMV